jgi:hypothetical protein
LQKKAKDLADPASTNGGAGGVARRDWILMPLIGLLTVAAMGVASEQIVARIFPEEKGSLAPCLISNDPTTGVRGVPNSVCVVDQYESGRIEYRQNSRGHRAGYELEPKPAGTYRIVLTGTSAVYGDYVRQQDTFASLLPAVLERRTGRRVEVYNEAILGGTPRAISKRFSDIAAAQPDMILWVLTPWDVNYADMLVFAHHKPEQESLPRRIYHRIHDSYTANVLLFLFYRSPSSTLKKRLIGMGNVGDLDRVSSPAWNAHLHDFESAYASVQEQARLAGLPLIVGLVPSRTAATMISLGEWPSAYDPYKIDRDLAQIVHRHGGQFIDLYPGFAATPHAEMDYYELARHLNPEGHRLATRLIADKLLEDSPLAHLSNATAQGGR